jgi:uncharacterized protein
MNRTKALTLLSVSFSKGGSSKLTTHPTLASNIKFMNFYPFAEIETISPRPLLFITVDSAHSSEFSDQFA